MCNLMVPGATGTLVRRGRTEGSKLWYTVPVPLCWTGRETDGVWDECCRSWESETRGGLVSGSGVPQIYLYQAKRGGGALEEQNCSK